MNRDTGSQIVIHVEETYTYRVDLAQTTTVSNEQESSSLMLKDAVGSVDILVPYDGLELREVPQEANSLNVGEIKVFNPDQPQNYSTLSVKIPGGDSLPLYFNSGLQAVCSSKYIPPTPQKPLVTVVGEVSDSNSLEELKKLIQQGTEAFINDLYLRLTLWVPNLFKRVQQSKTDLLHQMLLEQNSSTQVFLANSQDIEATAQSLAALANQYGGRLLLGVDERGRIQGIPGNTLEVRQKRTEADLLKAALRCNPLVH